MGVLGRKPHSYDSQLWEFCKTSKKDREHKKNVFPTLLYINQLATQPSIQQEYRLLFTLNPYVSIHRELSCWKRIAIQPFHRPSHWGCQL